VCNGRNKMDQTQTSLTLASSNNFRCRCSSGGFQQAPGGALSIKSQVMPHSQVRRLGVSTRVRAGGQARKHPPSQQCSRG
jgi:hypothetical protein